MMGAPSLIGIGAHTGYATASTRKAKWRICEAATARGQQNAVRCARNRISGAVRLHSRCPFNGECPGPIPRLIRHDERLSSELFAAPIFVRSLGGRALGQEDLPTDLEATHVDLNLLTGSQRR